MVPEFVWQAVKVKGEKQTIDPRSSVAYEAQHDQGAKTRMRTDAIIIALITQGQPMFV